MKIGVIGAGWSGLAAACAASRAGHEVVVWEMAAEVGGRARSGIDPPPDCPVDLDCGQHILIGAYSACLSLMKELGVDATCVLHRRPLELVDPLGLGLRLGRGHPAWAFLTGLWHHSHWSASEKWAVLRELIRWRLGGFECPADTTVHAWCRLPPRVMQEWIEPLCVAALNTPVQQASARTLMRVLADGLFAGPGGSDLLVPRAPLQELLPGPALEALRAAGGRLEARRRVREIAPLGSRRGWRVADGEFDRLIVATPAVEAARLLEPWDAPWAAKARSLRHDAIVTTWLRSRGSRLAAPMVSLPTQGDARCPVRPAQFAFDLGAIGHPWSDGFAFVTSAPGALLDDGLHKLEQAVLQQALHTDGLQWREPPEVVRSVAERRATFVCEAGLQRPPMDAARKHGGLLVAGDYVDGPYPSTLEGAVRSGMAAAARLNEP